MRTVCWITKATNTHSEYVILNTSPLNNGFANASHCYVTFTLSVLSYQTPSTPTLYTGLPYLLWPLPFLFWHSCLPIHISVFKIPLYFLHLQLILNYVALFPAVSLTVSFSALLSTPNKRLKLGPQLLSVLPPHLPLIQPEPCCGPSRPLWTQCPFQALFVYLSWLWSQQVPLKRRYSCTRPNSVTYQEAGN